MTAAQEIARVVGVSAACRAMSIPRSAYYRRLPEHAAGSDEDTGGITRGIAAEAPARRSSRALSEYEEQQVLAHLHSERFVDQSPGQVYAALLDEGSYLCSERTMYRILAKHGEVKERRNQRRHPSYTKPELLATRPNQVWSWDITKLKGPVKWTYFYLYVMLDIFSRYVVGWMVATRETAALARELIKETFLRQDVSPGELTIHADRGSPMKAKSTAMLMADLGVTKSHSRPYVSDDNPFSESQFKTLKYRPQFPERFGSLMDARAFCVSFFDWYNREHRHSGIRMMTPEMVHYGLAEQVRTKRQCILDAAHTVHPERFVHGKPLLPALQQEVWINPPKRQTSKPSDRNTEHSDQTRTEEDLH